MNMEVSDMTIEEKRDMLLEMLADRSEEHTSELQSP